MDDLGPVQFAKLWLKQQVLSYLGWSAGGWMRIREPYMGAWQRNDEITLDSVQANPIVFACQTLIASDIAKMRLRLVEMDANGIWTETENPAYSPVIRKPNRYQTQLKFIEQWMLSKLIHGNTYVLKAREDSRGMVTALYILDPTRVQPLVAEDGSVYYELRKEHLAGLTAESLVVPAREIIHDRGPTPFHPLIGVSPIVAAGLAAQQGLRIQQSSSAFFGNRAQPSGFLTAPGAIKQETAERLAAYWNSKFSGENAGKVAVGGDGLDFKQLTMKAVEAQTTEQLKATAEIICSAYRVPPYKVGVGPPPNYNNIEALNQQYYSECLQEKIVALEYEMDEGLGLKRPLGVEFDRDELLLMDTKTRVEASANAVQSGSVAVNEARAKWLDLPPLPGGDSAYMQSQNVSLEALSKAKAPADQIPPPQPSPQPENDEMEELRAVNLLLTKAAAHGWRLAA